VDGWLTVAVVCVAAVGLLLLVGDITSSRYYAGYCNLKTCTDRYCTVEPVVVESFDVLQPR